MTQSLFPSQLFWLFTLSSQILRRYNIIDYQISKKATISFSLLYLIIRPIPPLAERKSQNMSSTSANQPITSPSEIQHNREYEFASPDECLYCNEESWHQCQYCAKPTADPPAREPEPTNHTEPILVAHGGHTVTADEGNVDSSPAAMTDGNTSNEGAEDSSLGSDGTAVEDEVMWDYCSLG